MQNRLIAALAVLPAASAMTQQIATYSISFEAPTGPNTAQLMPGQSVAVYVNVAFTPTTPVGVVLGLAGGGFSIELLGSSNMPVTWSTPALVFPYNSPSGNAGAGCYNFEGVVWDTGPLATPTHPLPNNLATVWTGSWAASSGGQTLLFIADLAPTRVWVLPAGAPAPIEAVYESMPGGGGQVFHGHFGTCYPNCDGSVVPPWQPTLTIADFACFQAKFAAAQDYADCNKDCQLTIADFSCFQGKFVAGCGP